MGRACPPRLGPGLARTQGYFTIFYLFQWEPQKMSLPSIISHECAQSIPTPHKKKTHTMNWRCTQFDTRTGSTVEFRFEIFDKFINEC